MPESGEKTILLLADPKALNNLSPEGELHRYTLKDVPPERLFKAICAISNGDLWVDDTVRKHIEPGADHTRPSVSTATNPQAVRAPSASAISEALPAKLSPRDREVLRMIAAGATNRQIAQRLFLSISTIKLIIRRLLDLFQVGDRTQAAVFATKHGLI
jgi:DNA-binding NarL/FixJ family response regulator